MTKQERPVFVDTNISTDTLKTIAGHDQVLIMLADPMISVNRFFERPDRDKQYICRLLMEEPDPEKSDGELPAGTSSDQFQRAV